LLLGLDASMKGKMTESFETAGRNALHIPACNLIHENFFRIYIKELRERKVTLIDQQTLAGFKKVHMKCRLTTD
jgi:hypothetical protein